MQIQDGTCFSRHLKGEGSVLKLKYHASGFHSSKNMHTQVVLAAGQGNNPALENLQQ